MQALLSNKNIHVLVAEDKAQIVGCVSLTSIDIDTVEIGMLTVDPFIQARAIGKQLLLNAEVYAMQLYTAKTLEMSVVHTRSELIAYYERRGYQTTEKIKPYPVGQGVGVPQVPLHLIVMQKHVVA